jgi:hypothetical protein
LQISEQVSEGYSLRNLVKPYPCSNHQRIVKAKPSGLPRIPYPQSCY